VAYSDHEVQPGRFEMRSESMGTSHLLSIRGELDANACPGLEAELMRAEENGAERIVVDLSELTFIDSTGIALLVAAARRSEQDSGRLSLIPSRSEDVQRLLELCGLDGHLPILEEHEN
jgi:anti-sigma B factor antagonist